ncbi:DUF6723 family protein (plasmid) [Paraburkholderia strydomiana]
MAQAASDEPAWHDQAPSESFGCCQDHGYHHGPGAGYRIYPGYQRTPTGEYVGTLRVVRLRDSKLLYPFDGAAQIGPCSTGSEARQVAERVGGNVVLAVIRNPEP